MLFGKLVAIYKKAGFDIRIGLNPFHFNNSRDAPFCALSENGRILHTGGGLSLQEIYLLDHLSEVFQPKNILIVGNAFGWSTCAFALAFPSARVICIDDDSDGGDTKRGRDITSEICKTNGLRCDVIKAHSPDDIPLIRSMFDENVDLAFIDGLHTDDQQLADFRAIHKIMANNSAILFHDVVNWKMTKSFSTIQSEWNGQSSLLMRTSSGMGICARGLDELYRTATLFSESNIPAISKQKSARVNKLLSRLLIKLC